MSIDFAKFLIQHTYSGQTEPVENSGADADDFLARERAILGEDANQFATPQDHAATVEGGDNEDDLLGGAEGAPAQHAAPEEIAGFESSFPAIDTQNEVCFPGLILNVLMLMDKSPYSKSLLAARLPAPDHHSPRLVIQVIRSQRKSRNP